MQNSSDLAHFEMKIKFFLKKIKIKYFFWLMFYFWPQMTFFVWLDKFPKEINDLWKFLKISFKYYVQSNKWKEVLGEFAETYITT